MAQNHKTVKINNINYIIKNKNDIIENTLLKGVQWNNQILLLIGYWIKKYKLKHFLNVGCHIGTVALPISKYVNKVTAIEPFPPTFQHFIEHVELNNISNIESFNLALGSTEENIYFLDHKSERVKNNSGGIHVIREDDIKSDRLSSNSHSKKFKSKMIMLDNLPCENFDIMLVDVEGYEFELFKGGEEKISKYRPIIIMEIWGNKKRKEENMQSSKEEVVNYISNKQYKLIKSFGDNHIFFPSHLKL